MWLYRLYNCRPGAHMKFVLEFIRCAFEFQRSEIKAEVYEDNWVLETFVGINHIMYFTFRKYV